MHLSGRCLRCVIVATNCFCLNCLNRTCCFFLNCFVCFQVPDPAAPDDDGLRLFDYLAMLLYVSASSSVDAGVRRAFRTMANGDAPMKRDEIARIVTGGIGALDDLQVEALGLVFNGKSDAARIQLEPILANPHGKAMMLGQKIYLKKDLYK